MSATTRTRRFGAGLVLAAVLLAIGASAANAGETGSGRGRQQGNCMELVRLRYRMPPTLDPPNHPLGPTLDNPDSAPAVATEKNGGIEHDEQMLVTYCREGDAWRLTEDNLPYDAPNLCLTLQAESTTPPDRIQPVDDIDRVAKLAPRVFSAEETNDNRPTYCREGDGWTRQERPPEPPPPPPQTDGECRDMWRKWVDMPDPVESDEALRSIGTPIDQLEGAAAIYRVRYCKQPDGTWRKTQDAFPYDDPELCVYVAQSPQLGAPQASDGVIDSPDDHGWLEPRGAAGRADAEIGFYYFCRQGEGWKLSDAPESTRNPSEGRPEGSYEQWSDECVTILPTGGDLTERIDSHPSVVGSTDFRIQYVDVRELQTYCLVRGSDPQTGPWWRVDDYPLDQVAEQSGRVLSDPDQGTCVVIVDPIMEGGFPEVITPPGSPGEWGGIVAPGDYTNAGYGDAPPETSLFCWMGFAWVRGDVMSEGCRALGDLGILKNRPGSSLLPDDCWGSFPTDSYDIGYESQGVTGIGSNMTGWLTDTFFSVGKAATSVALWAIDWAYGFEMGDFQSFAVNIGEKYRVNLTENVRFRLADLAFLLLTAWAAINILRGKFALAGGEVVMSVLLMALGGLLMANRAGYMNSMDTLMEKASVDLMLAGQGEDPAGDNVNRDIGKVIDGVQEQIHLAMVEEPYDYLNWGRLLSGDCAKTRNTLLAQGPWNTQDAPRASMSDAGCRSEADFNAKPSGTRLLASGLSMAASLVVAGTLSGVSLTVVSGKVIALLLFAVAPFAVVVAGFPAGLRRGAWIWVTSAGQVTATVVGAGAILSLLLLSVIEVLQGARSIGLVERFAMVLIFVLVLNAIRRRLNASAASSAGRLADNLTNFRLGGGSHWAGPAGTSGLALTDLEDSVSAGRRRLAVGAAWAGGAALAGAAGVAASSWSRWRTGRVGLRNLRRMERYKERRDGLVSLPWRPGRGGGGRGPGPRGPGGGPGGPGPGPGGPGPGPGPGRGRGRGPGRGGPYEIGWWPRRPHGPRPSRPTQPRRAPRGGFASTQWELAKDRLHLGRGAEVAASAWRSAAGGVGRGWRGATHGVGQGWRATTRRAGRAWDGGTAAMGRGAGRLTHGMSVGHPGPGGRPLRGVTMQARWAEREAARPHNRQAGWMTERTRERRGVNAEYLARKAEERRAAWSLGRGRRTLTAQERKDLFNRDRSPREDRRAAMQAVNNRWADHSS
jgi:hypothetical protein